MRISASSAAARPTGYRAGYTMLEVVVVVAIMATALSLATPAFIRMIEQQRVQTVLRGVNLGLTEIRATSQLESRPIDAVEIETRLAQDLPVQWYVSVDETVGFSAAGTCGGGSLLVTTPARREYSFSLADRTCTIDSVAR